MCRPIRLAALAVAAATIAACGGTANHTSSPAPRQLSLLQSGGRAAAEPALYPQRPTTYVLDGTLADLGADAPVHQLIAHDATAAEVERISGALGMHGTPARTETGWELRDGEAQLIVGPSTGLTSVEYLSTAGAGSSPGSVGSSGGASTGVDVAPPVPSETVPSETVPPETVPPATIPAPVDVPSADAAANIAQSLLDGLGVLSGQQWSHSVSDTGGIAVACAAGVPCDAPPPTVTARTVTYALVVDGVAVPGVGWSVTIGEHRRVESVSGTWARPQVAGIYALRATQDVFDDLRNGRARYVGPQPLTAMGAPEIAPDPITGDTKPLPAIEVHITGVSLGRARWDGTENEHAVTYLVPTYRFHARVADGTPYEVELLALDPASFAIVAAPGTGEPKPGEPGASVVPGETTVSPASN
jgi:hypothetical protein